MKDDDEEAKQQVMKGDDGRLWGDGDITSLLQPGPNCTVRLAVPEGPEQISWNREDMAK